MKKELLLTLASAILAFSSTSLAEDWPTYRKDNRRSAVSKESLKLPLKQVWNYRSEDLPSKAWSGPAKWDAYSANKDLQSMRNFDPVYYSTVAQGLMFFADTSSNSVHGVNLKSRKTAWRFFTDAAVRMPPRYYEGLVIFGTDGGVIHALNAQTGEEAWSIDPFEDLYKITSNGRMISRWPCRTDIMIEGGKAYFALSLVAFSKSYLICVEPKTGAVMYKTEHGDATLQGALLTDGQKIYSPQGRSAPKVFNLADGKSLGEVKGAGGTFCLLTDNDGLITMPHNQREKENVFKVTDTKSNAQMLSFQGTNRILADRHLFFLHNHDTIVAINSNNYAAVEKQEKELAAQLRALKKSLKSAGDKAYYNLLMDAKIVQATKHYASSKPSFANDGLSHDRGKHYDGMGMPASITFQLKEAKEVSAFRMFNYWDGRSYQYQIEGSMDGKSWKTLVDYRKNTKPAAEKGDHFPIKATRVRFVRATAYKSTSGKGFHVVELEALDNKTLKKDGLKAKVADLEKRYEEAKAKKDKAVGWKKKYGLPFEFAKDKTKLYIGYNNSVLVVDARNGKRLQELKVKGKAYGLTVANGHLIVSTDKGQVAVFKGQ